MREGVREGGSKEGVRVGRSEAGNESEGGREIQYMYNAGLVKTNNLRVHCQAVQC